MQRIFSLLAMAALPLGAQAQTVLHNTAGTIHIGASGLVYVAGDVYNGTGATLNNLGMLTVTGAFNNDAPMAVPAPGTLHLNGTAPQTLSGAAGYSATDVIVNNPAGITLSTPLKIDGVMSFGNGIVNAVNPAYPVVFSANASVSGVNPPSNASHVSGYVTREGSGSFTYPTGDGTSYQPVSVALSANSAGLTARYYAADAGSATFGTGGTSAVPLLYHNTKEYWDLTPAGTAAGSVTIYWDSYNTQRIGNVSDLRVAHLSGGAWLNEGAAGAAGTTVAGSVTSNSLSSWSPFTLGSVSAASPLPLHDLSISALALPEANRISWQPPIADDVRSFVIERSADGHAFSELGRQSPKAAGTAYVFDDIVPLRGKSCYRLRAEDAAGKAFYSNVATVQRAASGNGFFSIYPNPTRGGVLLSVSAAGEFTVSDLAGRTILHTQIAGSRTIDLSALTPGIYVAVFRSSGQTETTRLVKQ